MNSEQRMPFGKHKGTLVRELPGDYLKWLSTIELREPLNGAVKAALAWRPVNTTPSGRSSSTASPGPSPTRSESVLSGSQRPEAPKPKRQWIQRPEDENLSVYYSNGSNDGIPW
jgi:hypothetical protein